jgi:hypothetical protein
MSREHASLSQTLTRAEIEQILTRPSGRSVDRHGRPMGEPPAFDMPPEMVHGMQCWRDNRQKPALNGPRRSPLQTFLCGLGRSTLFAQHDVPSSPLRLDPREEVLMCGLIPMVRAPPRERSGPPSEGPVEHTLSPMACDGEAHLVPQTTIATRSGWGVRQDRLIQPQDPHTLALRETACAPPVACRPVGVRRAKAERGRFQAIPRRALARPTLRREAWM